METTSRDRKQKHKSSVDVSTMMYGKVPPQAKELEKSILGALMQEKNAYDAVSSFLTSDAFYVDAHQRIYATIGVMKAKGMPVDLLTTVEELKRREELDMVGGPHYLMKLSNEVTSSAHIETHGRIVYQKFLQRELIRIGGEMIGEAYEDATDVFDLLDDSEAKLSRLSVSHTTKPYRHISEFTDDVLDGIEALRHTEETITGVPSGIHKLDKVTQGWQKQSLIILAARPGVGKSALAGNLAINAALNGIRPTNVGIFSLEMSTIQWVIRMLSAEARVEKYLLKRGRVSDEEMEHLRSVAKTRLAGAGIWIDDSAGLNMQQFRNKARQMVLKDKCGLIIVDYLQLMSGKRERNDNREQEVSGISRDLKQLAKELNVPIIALSQLSRQGDTAEPKLRDLRESGAIEQDADEVYFLIPISEEEVKQDSALQDGLFISIAKHRDSILDKIAVRFVKQFQKIMNEDEYQAYMHPNKAQPLALPSSFKPVNMQTGKIYTTEHFDEGFNRQTEI